MKLTIFNALNDYTLAFTLYEDGGIAAQARAVDLYQRQLAFICDRHAGRRRLFLPDYR